MNSMSLPEIAAALTGGIVAIAFFAQKLYASWHSTKAETSVLSLMHTELERMGTQNTRLSVELGKLQAEVIQLNQELRKLTIENQRLHGEIAILTSEVSRLQALIKQGGSSGRSS